MCVRGFGPHITMRVLIPRLKEVVSNFKEQMDCKQQSTANEMIQITQQNVLMLKQISFEIIAYLEQHRSEPELSKQVHEVVAEVFPTHYNEL